jgi:CspA family cold shock protein
MTTATAREWHDDLGWGVLDSPETPGGCWTHFSNIETPYVGSVDGADAYEYKGLSMGEVVELEWETPVQDGFNYRAVAVSRRR